MHSFVSKNEPPDERNREQTGRSSANLRQDKKNKSDIKYGDSYEEATVIAEKMKGLKS
jgi:hypothetical protein